MRELTLGAAIREAMSEEMRRDGYVFCLGEDIGIEGGWGGPYTISKGMSEEFGHERILDTPISEAGLFGVAVGAAMRGLRPIAELQYADFVFCMMDQLVNQAAKMCYMSGGQVSIPLVLRAPVGATSRGAQHSQCIESWCMHTPGLKVVCPSTPYDAKGLMKAAVRDDNPVVFLEHKLLYGRAGTRTEGIDIKIGTEIPDEDYIVPIGKANVVREGSDLTLVTSMLMLHKSLAVADELAGRGISVEVIDIRSILPFDGETILASLMKTGLMAIVEEDTKTLGWGAEIAAFCYENAFASIKKPVKRIAASDTPTPCAEHLENAVIPQVADIEAGILELF